MNSNNHKGVNRKNKTNSFLFRTLKSRDSPNKNGKKNSHVYIYIYIVRDRSEEEQIVIKRSQLKSQRWGTSESCPRRNSSSDMMNTIHNMNSIS